MQNKQNRYKGSLGKRKNGRKEVMGGGERKWWGGKWCGNGRRRAWRRVEVVRGR
jgi:hypothetical protein